MGDKICKWLRGRNETELNARINRLSVIQPDSPREACVLVDINRHFMFHGCINFSHRNNHDYRRSRDQLSKFQRRSYGVGGIYSRGKETCHQGLAHLHLRFRRSSVRHQSTDINRQHRKPSEDNVGISIISTTRNSVGHVETAAFARSSPSIRN